MVEVKQADQICRIKQTVRDNWRKQIVCFFVKPGQCECEDKKRDKNRNVAMDECEQRTDTKPGEFWIAKLFDERKQHAAKNKFFRDRRQQNGKETEIHSRWP